MTTRAFSTAQGLNIRFYNHERAIKCTFSSRMDDTFTLFIDESMADSDNRRTTSVSQSTLDCTSRFIEVERRFIVSSAILMVSKAIGLMKCDSPSATKFGRRLRNQ